MANAFIKIAQDDGKRLTHMKIQKLVYYAQGWHLGTKSRPLVSEQVEAWKHGPVFPMLFHRLKNFGADEISRPLTVGVDGDPLANKDDAEFLRAVWKAYGNFSAIQLSAMTHEDGSPWSKTWDNGNAPAATDIPKELIERHFKGLLERADAK